MIDATKEMYEMLSLADRYPRSSERRIACLNQATDFAEIAQAEQLKRIADILEKYHEETTELISTLD